MTIQTSILAVALAVGSAFAQTPATPTTPASPAAPTAPAPVAKPKREPRTAESAVTPATRNENRRKGFLEAGKKPGIQIVFLGDSISDAWPGRGKEAWNEHYAPFNAVSFGVSGERTEDTLGHIEGGVLDGLNPKVVVIMIGTNNIGHFAEEKPEWAAAGVKKIIEKVQAKLPSSKILLLSVFPRDKKDSPKRKAVEGINAIISTYGDGKKVTYLDLTSKFLGPDGEIPKDIMPDLLHPNAAGYKIWAEAMKPTLDSLMK
jgi:lysophospholipase L1-like esterase